VYICFHVYTHYRPLMIWTSFLIDLINTNRESTVWKWGSINWRRKIRTWWSRIVFNWSYQPAVLLRNSSFSHQRWCSQLRFRAPILFWGESGWSDRCGDQPFKVHCDMETSNIKPFLIVILIPHKRINFKLLYNRGGIDLPWHRGRD